MLAKILRPFAKLIAFILSESGVSFEKVIYFSYLVTFAILAFFYISLVKEPYYDVYKLIVVALLLLSAFIYEVIIEVATMQDQGRSIKLYWDRYMDLIIYTGLIIILGFAFVEVRILDYYIFEPVFYFILGLLLLGIVLMEWSRDEYLAPPSDYMDSRSTRLIIMSFFLFYGTFSFKFENMIFLGLLAVNILIYIGLLAEIIRVVDLRFLNRIFSIPRNMVVSFVTKMGRLFFILTLYLKSSNISLRSLKFPRPEKTESEVEPGEEVEKKADGESDSLSTYLFTVVINDYRNVPLQNVMVTLIHIKSGIEEVGYTNEKGRIDFHEVVPAQYKVVIEGGGVKKEVHDRYISMDYGEVFSVQRSMIDLSVVVNQKGTTAPIPEARITLEQPIDKLVFKGKTNNLGIAYFEELPILDFAMTIIAKGYNPYSRIISLMAENVISVSLSTKKKEVIDYKKAPLTPKIKKNHSYGADKIVKKEDDEEIKVEEEKPVQIEPKQIHPPIKSPEEIKPAKEKVEIETNNEIEEKPLKVEEEKNIEISKETSDKIREMRIKEIQEKIGAVRGKIISNMSQKELEDLGREEGESKDESETPEEILEDAPIELSEEDPEEKISEIQDASLEGSALLEYGTGIKPGEVVMPIVREHIQNDRVVYVVTTPARINSYWTEFEGYIMEGSVKLINLAPSAGAPITNENIIEISTKKLDDLIDVFDNIPIGGLFVFEPLSSLIFNRGFAPAHNFIKKAAKILSEEGLLFVCLVKKDNHNPPEIKKLENIFNNVGLVQNGSMVKIK